MAGIAAVPLKKVVVDSGPLYSLLTLEVVKRHPGSRNSILSRNKVQSYLQSPRAQKNFLLMFSARAAGWHRSTAQCEPAKLS